MKHGANEPCHCGSEKKYKKCCMLKDEEAARNAAAVSAAAAAAVAPAADAPARPAPRSDASKRRSDMRQNAAASSGIRQRGQSR
jgi:hypothetical protein